MPHFTSLNPKRSNSHQNLGTSHTGARSYDITRAKCKSRLRLKCDSTRAENRFRLSAKRTSLFNSTGASVQSTTGSRGVRISGSNAGYTMFRGNVKGTGYPLHSPVSPSLPLPCVTACHHISAGLYKLSGSCSGYCLREKSLLGSYSSLENKFALEELAAFIFRVSEFQVAAASVSYSA